MLGPKDHMVWKLANFLRESAYPENSVYIHSLRSSDTIKQKIWINIVSGNGLSSVGPMLSPEPMLTCDFWDFVALTWDLLHT